MTALGSYLRMPPASRALAREALREFVKLRWLTKERKYPESMRRFGSPRAPLPDETGPEVGPAQALEARRIGNMVEAVAPRLPWDANCVAKAIVAHAMLDRRGIPSRAFVGAKREALEDDLDLHAWLMAGKVVVTGAPVRAFRAVATYEPEPAALPAKRPRARD